MDNSRFKFRVWDRQEKHMHYMPAEELHEKFFLRADGVLCDVLYDPEYSDPLPVDDRYELSFSSRLLDCDVKEIWEGDIVSLRGHPSYPTNGKMETMQLNVTGLVEYSNADAQWFVTRANGVSKTALGGYRSWEVETRVIGNRFESPELLDEVGR